MIHYRVPQRRVVARSGILGILGLRRSERISQVRAIYGGTLSEPSIAHPRTVAAQRVLSLRTWASLFSLESVEASRVRSRLNRRAGCLRLRFGGSPELRRAISLPSSHSSSSAIAGTKAQAYSAKPIAVVSRMTRRSSIGLPIPPARSGREPRGSSGDCRRCPL